LILLLTGIEPPWARSEWNQVPMIDTLYFPQCNIYKFSRTAAAAAAVLAVGLILLTGIEIRHAPPGTNLIPSVKYI